MVKGEITINESYCQGCGYCEMFCPREAITMPDNKFNPQGFRLPVFSSPEKCNACGICGWMCPHYAIEVYKYVETDAAGIPT